MKHQWQWRRFPIVPACVYTTCLEDHADEKDNGKQDQKGRVRQKGPTDVDACLIAKSLTSSRSTVIQYAVLSNVCCNRFGQVSLYFVEAVKGDGPIIVNGLELRRSAHVVKVKKYLAVA